MNRLLATEDRMSSSESESINSATNKRNACKWDYCISEEGELFYMESLLQPVGSMPINEPRNTTRNSGTGRSTCNTDSGNTKSANKPLKEQKPITSFHNYAMHYNHFFMDILKDINEVVTLIILFMANEICEDVLFSYPKKEVNDILSAKGSFFTLQSIIKNNFKTELLLSSLNLGDKIYNVYYKNIENTLLIFGVNNKNFKGNTLLGVVSEFFEYLTIFHLKNLPINSENEKKLKDICEILNINFQTSDSILTPFLNLTSFLKLPKDTEAKIHNALNEMSAMDYRDWNDEPLISHREFFICGSLLYFNTYLLANQLPTSHSNPIKQILNFSGILKAIEKNFIQELIFWHEIPFEQSEQRYFVVICTRNNLTIACLLQTNYVNNSKETSKIIYPSAFYIEEIQDTLDYLNEKGIKSISQNIIDAKKCEEDMNNKSYLKFDGIRKTDDVKLPIFGTSGHSNNSQTHSEESVIRDDDRSEMDSEWDGFPSSFKSASEFDKNSDYKKGPKSSEFGILIEGMFKRKGCYISHVIQVNYGSGLLISHIEKPDQILEKFKSCCELIHSVLQSMPPRNRSAIIDFNNVSNQRKSLNKVKEHGVHLVTIDSIGNSVPFWVIGRLIDSPCGELYVCHYEDIPQNLIEIAFRLLMQDTF
ncbi:protein inturned isoform X2 [Condylostylus longicornis]|nr:protein inturned isoform X2 [Condylostylus longicornis]